MTEKQEKLPWLKIDFDRFAFEDEDESEDDDSGDKLMADELIKKLEKDLADEAGK